MTTGIDEIRADAREDDWDPQGYPALIGRWSPDVLLLIDPLGTFQHVGESVRRVLGYDPESRLGDAVWDFVHPDDLVAAAGALNEASRTTGYHLPTEMRIRHADGHFVDCELTGNAVDGPGGAWLVLSVRASGDRNEVIGRRRQIEQLIRMASLECAAARWNEVDALVGRFLQDLAEVVGAEMVELAWEVRDQVLRVGARWPAVSSATRPAADQGEFVPLWPLEDGVVSLLRFSSDLESLEPSPARDRLIRLRARAVVEVPLSTRAPWGVIRLVFGEDWRSWDDTNVDLVTVLVNTLTSTLRRCRAEARLQEQACTDPLTGLLNRVELYRCFEQILTARDEGRRVGDAHTVGVLYGDLDRFKEVNDRFGHAAGDELLVAVADALRAGTREGDLISRFGGDEFVIVCPSLESPEALDQVRDRVQRAVGAIRQDGITAHISLGAALAADGLGADDLVRLADEAMYRSKRDRRRAGGGQGKWAMASSNTRNNAGPAFS